MKTILTLIAILAMAAGCDDCEQREDDCEDITNEVLFYDDKTCQVDDGICGAEWYDEKKGHCVFYFGLCCNSALTCKWFPHDIKVELFGEGSADKIGGCIPVDWDVREYHNKLKDEHEKRDYDDTDSDR